MCPYLRTYILAHAADGLLLHFKEVIMFMLWVLLVSPLRVRDNSSPRVLVLCMFAFGNVRVFRFNSRTGWLGFVSPRGMVIPRVELVMVPLIIYWCLPITYSYIWLMYTKSEMAQTDTLFFEAKYGDFYFCFYLFIFYWKLPTGDISISLPSHFRQFPVKKF